MEIQTQQDIVQLGLIEEKITDDNLFMAFSNFGMLRQPFIFNQHHLYFQTDLMKGYTQSVKVVNKWYDALYSFEYYDQKGDVQQRVTTTEVEFKARYAYHEHYLLNDNRKFTLEKSRYPVLTLTYTRGISGILKSGFDYDRISMHLTHRLATGALGISNYNITAGKVFGTLPYPLLKVHLGNETVFHNQRSFNLMNYFEFVSDQYLAIKYQHSFMGNVLNRIPIMKRLKWRLLAETNILFGSLSSSNTAIYPSFTTAGQSIAALNGLETYKPYIEVGYGIENIFRLLRIEAFHRLTYYDNSQANRFGVRVALQFEL